MSNVLTLLDNTVLSNLARASCTDLAFNLWPNACATTEAVIQEFHEGVRLHGLSPDSWNLLPIKSLTIKEELLLKQMPSHLGPGERTCIAIAISRGSIIACDDLKARRFAQKHEIRLTGTVGILVLNVKQQFISKKEGNALLKYMIEHNFRSPLSNLDDYV